MLLTAYSHELYNYSVTLDMYLNFAPKFPGRYLSSNVNITVGNSNGSVINVPVGSKCQNLILTQVVTDCILLLIHRSLRQVHDAEVGHIFHLTKSTLTVVYLEAERLPPLVFSSTLQETTTIQQFSLLGTWSKKLG